MLPSEGGLLWTLEVRVPRELDPQHPRHLYRLCDYQERSLIERLGESGKGLRVSQARTLKFCCVRRGSWVAARPATYPRVWIGLTSERWPAEWGGTIVGELEAEPLGLETLWFIPAGRPTGITMAERLTETWWLDCALETA